METSRFDELLREPIRVLRRWTAVQLLALAALLPLVSACGGGLSEEEVQQLVDARVADTVAETVKARRFEVVDDVGATRIVLTTLEGGRPSLTLADENGAFRAWLFLRSDGSPNLVLLDRGRVVLMDQAGEIRSAQHLTADGSPAVSLMDAAGQVRSGLFLAEDGAPTIELYDEGSQLIWSSP